MKKTVALAIISLFLNILFSGPAAAATPEDELLKAAANDDFVGVMMALENGAAVDARDRKGMTSLMMAAGFGNARIVALLLEKGADPEAKNPGGETALSIAEAKGHDEAVGLLKKAAGKKKPSPAAQDGSGAPARYVVGGGGSSPSPEKLASLNQEMLSAALEGDAAHVKSRVEEGASIDAKGPGGSTVLMMAVNQNLKELFDLALECKADVNARDDSGGTALYYAFRKGNARFVELLLGMGAYLDVKGEKEIAVFTGAIRGGNLPVVKIFAEKGAKVTGLELDGRPAAIFCVEKEYYEMAKLLVEKGADVNSKDRSGKTLLMYAAEFGPKDFCDFLKSKGADEKAKDDKGLTAAEYGSADRKKRVFYEKVDYEILLSKKYFVDFMEEKFERGTDEVGPSYSGISASKGHITFVDMTTEGVSVQKRAPFGTPFAERVAGLASLAKDKYKDDKIKGKIISLNDALAPFAKKSNEIYDALAQEYDPDQPEKRSPVHDTIPVYVDSYMNSSEEIKKMVLEIEAEAKAGLNPAEAPKAAAPPKQDEKPKAAVKLKPAATLEVEAAGTSSVGIAGAATAPVEVRDAGTAPVEAKKGGTVPVEIRKTEPEASGTEPVEATKE